MMWHRLKGFWKKESANVSSAAFLIGGASLVSRFIGFIRDRLLTSAFGAGLQLDSYYVAFKVPDLVFQLIVLGAISSGFIPVFTEVLQKKGKEGAQDLTKVLLLIMSSALVVVGLIVAFFAKQLIELIAPGFEGQQLMQTVLLMRWLLISMFILGVSSIMGGVLQAKQRFIPFALAPIVYNLGIIFGILFLAPYMGIKGVVIGVVLGSLLHLITQLFVAGPIIFENFHFHFVLTEDVKKIVFLTIPRLFGLAGAQINLIVLTAFASSLAIGSVTVFNLANNLQFVPIGLIGVSFAVASFASFSKLVVNEDLKGLKREFLMLVRKITFFILPIMAVMLLLRVQIVRILFGGKMFDWVATVRTSDVLAIFVLSLLAQALIPLITRVFYALQNTRTPVVISIFSVLLNIGLAYLLKDDFGVLGLAASLSIASFVQFGLLWWFLRRYLGGHLDTRKMFLANLKVLIASLSLFGFGWLGKQLIGSIFPLRTFWQVLLQIFLALLFGGIMFVMMSYLLKIEEFFIFLNLLKKKIFKPFKLIEGMDEIVG